MGRLQQQSPSGLYCLLKAQGGAPPPPPPTRSCAVLMKRVYMLLIIRTQSKSEEAGPSQLLPSCRASVMLPSSASACRVALPPVLAIMDAGLQPARRD